MDICLKNLDLAELKEFPAAGVDTVELEACPACGSGDLVDIAVMDGVLTYSWCRDCGHAFHRRRPDAAWYGRWYKDSWGRHVSTGPKKRPVGNIGLFKFKRSLRLLVGKRNRPKLFAFCEDAVKPGDHVLDVGCSHGMNLLPFQEYGCHTYGIEPSLEGVEHARQLGIDALQMNIEDLGPETFAHRPDFIFSNHVLEHILDPQMYFEAIKRTIRPGGQISITVPNFHNGLMILQFMFMIHVQCFTRTSLFRLLDRHGFRVKRFLEERQLRVLAQYDPDGTLGIPGFERRPADDKVEPPVGDIFRNLAGRPPSDPVDASVDCEWWTARSSDRVERGYRHRYGGVGPEPHRKPNKVTLEMSGEASLPIRLSVDSEEPGFWVK